MGGHRLRASEAIGVIQGSLEGQRGDKADAWRGHEQLANRIVMHEYPDALDKPAVEMTAGVQQRTQRFDQRGIGDHSLARHIVEPGMIDLRR